MKALVKAVAVSSLVLAGSQAMATDVGNGFDASANVGLVSDYLWRGISQSDKRGAIQGGLDLKHESGAYIGTWMSSVYLPYNGTKRANTEQDGYIGYKFNVAELAFDLRYTDYHYAGATGLDFTETHADVSAFGAVVGVDYSNDTVTAAGTGSALHYYAGYSYTFPMDIVGTATVGRYDLKDDVIGNHSAYSYNSVGVSKTLLDINWGVAYSSTNVSSSGCASYTTDKDYCGSAWVFSATKKL